MMAALRTADHWLAGPSFRLIFLKRRCQATAFSKGKLVLRRPVEPAPDKWTSGNSRCENEIEGQQERLPVRRPYRRPELRYLAKFCI